MSEAENGEADIAWLEGNEADLVMLDISMPDMSGIDVCAAIRAGRLGGDGIVIAAYTAHAMPDEQAGFLSSGFDAVILKPLTKPALLETLATLPFRRT